MSLRINYNLAASVAQRSLGSSQDAYARMAERLSTGLRINKAGDDAAGMAVSERLKNQVRGLNVAGRNAQDGVSLIQTAEGALAETHSILGRLRELAVQAANDTLNSTDRANLQTEANQLVSEIDRIAASTQFNGTYLLNKNSTVSLHDGGDGLQFQIGANQTAASNQLTATLAAARAQDLGDVSTLYALDSGATTGAKTVTLGAVTGIKYNTEADTVFDLRDAINVGTASHGVTATLISSGGNTDGNGGITPGTASGAKLKLSSASATAFASDTGAVVAEFFGGANATTAALAARSTSTLADLGITADGTITFTAGVAAGTANQAVGTATLAEIGVAAAGTFGITLANGGAISVAYATTDTLSGLAANIQTALRAGTGATNDGATAVFTANTGFVLDASAGGGSDTFTTAATTGTAGHLTLLGLGAAPAAQAGYTSTLGGTALQTAVQSEAVAVSYTTTDTLATLAANVQT